MGTTQRAAVKAGAQNPVTSFSIRALMIGAPFGREGGFCQSHLTNSRNRPSPRSRTIGASSVGAMLYEPCHDFHQSSGLPPSATNSRTSSSVLSVQRSIREGSILLARAGQVGAPRTLRRRVSHASGIPIQPTRMATRGVCRVRTYITVELAPHASRWRFSLT